MSQKREQKICALVIWMNIAFLVCWLPYGTICIMYIFGGRGYVSPTVVVIPLLTAKTSVCWNPIIYIAMNPQVNNFSKTQIDYFWTKIVKLSIFFFVVSWRFQKILQNPWWKRIRKALDPNQSELPNTFGMFSSTCQFTNQRIFYAKSLQKDIKIHEHYQKSNGNLITRGMVKS